MALDNHQIKVKLGEVSFPLKLDQMLLDIEKKLILEALEREEFVKNRASKLLGINRTTLVEKVKRYFPELLQIPTKQSHKIP